VVQCFEFESYYEAKLAIESYVGYYINRRQHGEIDYKTPHLKWNDVDINEFCNFNTSGEAESGNAGAQAARNSLMTEDDLEEFLNPVSPFSKNKSSLVPMPKKTQNENEKNNLNFLTEFVQNKRC
jgi:hypothetical protein